MPNSSHTSNQIQYVSSFQELISSPFSGETNAICWTRNLIGDFSEIANKITLNENIVVLEQDELKALQLSEKGQLAREIILNDLQLLEAQGASPSLNVIKCYEKDDSNSFFSTDVYSFHVDRSPIPTATFLCTYFGAASDIVANENVQQKILVPEIREKLFELYDGFDDFLKEYFFDLHYQLNPDAKPYNLGKGNLWKLAVDHPEQQVLPCVHRAPKENIGEYRLLLIC